MTGDDIADEVVTEAFEMFAELFESFGGGGCKVFAVAVDEGCATVAIVFWQTDVAFTVSPANIAHGSKH